MEFQSAGSCDSDEWCTGITDAKNATTKRSLCSKGRNKQIPLENDT